MWKQLAVAAALVALAGGCEERNRPTSNGTVSGNRTTDNTRYNSGTNTGTMNDRTTTTDRTRDTSGLSTQNTAIAQPDTTFLQNAVVTNRFEIDLSKLALEKSQNNDVRAFAQEVGKDHADNQSRLKDVCDRIKVKVPSDDLQADQKQIRDQLNNSKGPDFDQQFVKTMIDGHQKAISMFEKEASQGENADLKQFAQTTLPTLRNHLSMARDLQNKLSGGQQMPGENTPESNPGQQQPGQQSPSKSDQPA